MSEEITKEAEAVVAESLPEQPKEFGAMNGDEKVQYIHNLREQAGVVPTKQEETPVVDDESPVNADAGKTVEPETEKPKTEETADWRDAEVRGLAEVYGIDEKKLAKIPSREVLDILLDSLELEPAAKAPEPAKEIRQTEKEVKAAKELEEFSLTNNDELGAEDAPKLVEKIRAQDKELRELREWQSQQQQAFSKQWLEGARSRVAESAMKAYPEFYGEPGKTPTKEQVARINELWQAHCDRAVIIEKRGGKPNESTEFVKRSIATAHGDLILSEIDKKQEQLNKLVAQSNRRTGGGSTKDLPTVGASPLEKNLAKLPQRLRSLGIAGV